MQNLRRRALKMPRFLPARADSGGAAARGFSGKNGGKHWIFAARAGKTPEGKPRAAFLPRKKNAAWGRKTVRIDLQYESLKTVRRKSGETKRKEYR